MWGLRFIISLMRTLRFPLILLCGLAIAGGVWSQERGRADSADRVLQDRVIQPRAQDVQRMQREELPRSQPEMRYPPRNERYDDAVTPRTRPLDERARGDWQSQRLQPDPRDPRAIDYRTRSAQQDFRGTEVPQGMQRAIERAQSEHGGKVLSADRIRYRGQDTYRVKLLTPGGRVRVVQLSGQVRSDADNEEQNKEKP